MKITEVKINLMPRQDNLKAFASITIDDCFVVHDLRVIKKDDKIFIAMPNKKIKSSQTQEFVFKDIAHPINKETRDEIEKTVLTEYDKVLKDMV